MAVLKDLTEITSPSTEALFYVSEGDKDYKMTYGNVVGLSGDVTLGELTLTDTLISEVADGTAPLTVASTTKVTNLNADKLDGADLDTTVTLGTSDTKIPSQKAVKTYVDNIINIVYPVGCFYTQYPNANDNDLDVAFPSAYSPETLFGGTWVKQWDTEGIDFHTERTSDTGLQTRTNGLQADQMQGHKHSPGELLSIYNGGAAGNYLGSSSGSYRNTGNPVTDGTSTLRTGTETCDKNRLVRIWKRTA